MASHRSLILESEVGRNGHFSGRSAPRRCSSLTCSAQRAGTAAEQNARFEVVTRSGSGQVRAAEEEHLPIRYQNLRVLPGTSFLPLVQRSVPESHSRETSQFSRKPGPVRSRSADRRCLGSSPPRCPPPLRALRRCAEGRSQRLVGSSGVGHLQQLRRRVSDNGPVPAQLPGPVRRGAKAHSTPATPLTISLTCAGGYKAAQVHRNLASRYAHDVYGVQQAVADRARSTHPDRVQDVLPTAPLANCSARPLIWAGPSTQPPRRLPSRTPLCSNPSTPSGTPRWTGHCRSARESSGRESGCLARKSSPRLRGRRGKQRHAGNRQGPEEAARAQRVRRAVAGSGQGAAHDPLEVFLLGQDHQAAESASGVRHGGVARRSAHSSTAADKPRSPPSSTSRSSATRFDAITDRRGAGGLPSGAP